MFETFVKACNLTPIIMLISSVQFTYVLGTENFYAVKTETSTSNISVVHQFGNMTLTTIPSARPYGHISQIIGNRLYFGSFHSMPEDDENTVHFKIDEHVHYHPFYDDFGPMNLAELYRACTLIKGLLRGNASRRVVICTDADDANRVNGAFLVASYMVIYEGLSADQAYLRVQRAEPPAFVGFTDASLGRPTYLLHLQHTIKAVEKAMKLKWLDFDTFDRVEYEHYERVENGDFNWIIPGKILSFRGPSNRSYIQNGYPYHSPDVYFDYFREKGVSTIVRLNTKLYDRKRFIDAGFDHQDLFFIDGSTPTDAIVERFFEIVDNAKGGVAIHCKAGLGRTGTLIACWMMKEFRLTAPQCIAWLRICRPGSVIGPQQQYLLDKEKWCWRHGVQNRTRSPNRPLSPRSQLDEEKNEEFSLDVVPPLPISQSTNKNVYDETAINEKGQSQGDRLIEMKLRSQRQADKDAANHNTTWIPKSSIKPHGIVNTSNSRRPFSPTTPIKKLHLSTSPRSPTARTNEPPNTPRRQLKMPISKVIVATTHHHEPTAPRPTIKTLRQQPYSTSNVNCAKYALRPRKNLVGPVRLDPAPHGNTSIQRQYYSSSALPYGSSRAQ
ncbi:Protein-tyrosine-phosphatase [Aphelenchoides besseyi]|nr:Protein-tyrosine-phosphatase [Aphelenchoides besseyi]